MAHLYMWQAGEAAWQGLLSPGRWHALPTRWLHICCLKESPQAWFSTKCFGLTGRASDPASTAICFPGDLTRLQKKKGSLVFTILQVEKMRVTCRCVRRRL